MQAVVKGAMFLSSSGGSFTNDRNEEISWQKSEWFQQEIDAQGNAQGSTVTLGLDSKIPGASLKSGDKYDLVVLVRNSRVNTKDGQRTVCRATVIDATLSK